jgi:hypothetical protein
LVLALVLPLGASANREVIKPDQDTCSLPDESWSETAPGIIPVLLIEN